LEAGLISKRTKDALAASKARGTTLGGYRGGPTVGPGVGLRARQDNAAAYAASVRPMVVALRKDGLSLRQVCAALQARGIRTPRGGQWVPQMVTQIVGEGRAGEGRA
jgi:DNA invertase Pin-like site-specific DNA recombinase